MPGIFKTGDKVHTVYKEAIPGRGRPMEAVVLSEPVPGTYQCQTDMGIAVLLPEAELNSV